MALITDATSTLERLTKLRTAAEGAEETKALDSLRVELAALANPINVLAAKVDVFRSEGVSLSPIQDLTNVRESVQKSFERFQQAPKATTLRRGTVWATLKNKLQTLNKNAQTALVEDWKQYFDSHFFSGLPPSRRGATLAKTPKNEEALKSYQELYQSFIKYRLQQPTSAEEFLKLRLLSQQLAKIEFQENVPEAVRMFLEASSAGAGLHLLTAEVLTWLHDNNLLANFVVRARIN